MKLDPNERSDNVEDYRGRTGGGGGRVAVSASASAPWSSSRSAISPASIRA
jgi:hypothetical protein